MSWVDDIPAAERAELRDAGRLGATRYGVLDYLASDPVIRVDRSERPSITVTPEQLVLWPELESNHD